MTDLHGQRFIITGAATGIGWAIARRMAATGAKIALLDIDAERIEQRANELQTEAIAIAGDVSDPSSVETSVSTALKYLGGVDVLVNNAATFTPIAPVTELSVQDWHHAIAVNLTGAFLMSRAVIPTMQQARSGVIINIASQLGSVASAGRAPYCAAKGGIIQLTKTMALDHAKDGIRVNSLSPGAVLTERLTRMFGSEQDATQALAPKHPLGRLGQAEEIAHAAAFLASPDSSFMTGADLLVDGGYNAQ